MALLDRSRLSDPRRSTWAVDRGRQPEALEFLRQVPDG